MHLKKMQEYIAPKETSLATSLTKKATQDSQAQLESKRIIEDKSEYWEYLYYSKTWDIQEEGLLIFIRDVFKSIERRKMRLGDGLAKVLNLIKTILNKMNDTLLRIDDELNKLDKSFRLTKYLVAINDCLDAFPYRKLMTGPALTKTFTGISKKKAFVKIEKDSDSEDDAPLKSSLKRGKDDQKEHHNVGFEESNDVDHMINKMRNFIVRRKVTIEEFMGMFN